MIPATSCADPLDIDNCPPTYLHVPVVPVSKEDDGQNLKQRRLVGHRLVDVPGGIKSREEKDEPCCSVWSHVSFTLLSVVVFSTS